MLSASHGFGAGLPPPMGTRLIDSTPPVRTTSDQPATISPAPVARACSPDEQKRFIVIAGTVIGRPARRTARRATFMPCSASGKAQPTTTSSMTAGSNWGTFSRKPWIRRASNSSGRVCRKVPRPDRPTAVR